MATNLADDKFWVNKHIYHDAEKSFYEGATKDGVGMTNVTKDPVVKSSLAVEVAKAREIIKTKMQCVDGMAAANNNAAVGTADITRLESVIKRLEACFLNLEKRLDAIERKCNMGSAVDAVSTNGPNKPSIPVKEKSANAGEDDNVDLFGSDSEEEDEEAKKIREQRLAEYAAKKSKKPVLIAKSNIILDIKPWDDTTDMKKLEEAVREVKMDGLIWGASKLVPLVFGIYKLQISCVVEDDKVSVDQLTDTLEEIQAYIQSVDIAAFNKV